MILDLLMTQISWGLLFGLINKLIKLGHSDNVGPTPDSRSIQVTFLCLKVGSCIKFGLRSKSGFGIRTVDLDLDQNPHCIFPKSN